MFKHLFISNVYVKILKNKFIVKNVSNNIETTLIAKNKFTSTRLLIGEFMAAEALLKQALKNVCHGNWLSPSPSIIMHPLEMIEGGLSEVEDRAIKELAYGSGARKVIVWLGEPLSDSQVVDLLKSKQVTQR